MSDCVMFKLLADECETWGHDEWANRLRKLALREAGTTPDAIEYTTEAPDHRAQREAAAPPGADAGVTDDVCGAEYIEGRESFFCTLPPEHDGPHHTICRRCFGKGYEERWTVPNTLASRRVSGATAAPSLRVEGWCTQCGAYHAEDESCPPTATREDTP